MALLVWEPFADGFAWWGACLGFFWTAFETACWSSGLYHYAFHEHGLCYGRVWVPYKEQDRFVLERDFVRVHLLNRRVLVRTEGAVSVEVKLRLWVEGWT